MNLSNGCNLSLLTNLFFLSFLQFSFFIVLSLLIDNSLPTMHFNLAYHKDFNADELSDPKSFKTTHEQVILFKLIDGIVDSQDEKTDAIVTELLCRFLTQELCKLCSLYTFTSNEEQIPLSSNDVEAIFLLFQILANISQYIKFHQAFIEEGLLDKTLGIAFFFSLFLKSIYPFFKKRVASIYMET